MLYVELKYIFKLRSHIPISLMKENLGSNSLTPLKCKGKNKNTHNWKISSQLKLIQFQENPWFRLRPCVYELRWIGNARVYIGMKSIWDNKSINISVDTFGFHVKCHKLHFFFFKLLNSLGVHSIVHDSERM